MTRRGSGHGVASGQPCRGDDVRRLTALLILTAAFAPAAVLGALPVVAPVMIVLMGLAVAVTAFDPAPVPVATEPAVTDPSASATR